jgi:putative transposase
VGCGVICWPTICPPTAPNPKAAGVRKGFHDTYSKYGHYEGLAGDGLSEWHPAFLPLAATALAGCAKRYAQ